MIPGINMPATGFGDSINAQVIEITSGSGNFLIPDYNQIIFEIWGGGGRGGGFSTTVAATGTTFTWPSGTMVANPGSNGLYGNEGSFSPATGGTASGGDVNTTGGTATISPAGWGNYGRGGNGPNGIITAGGVGGQNSAGAAPGGGGSSAASYNDKYWQLGSGGGGGGYSRKTFGPGTLVPGTTVSYSIGVGAVASGVIGNSGAGRLVITIT